MLISYFRNKMYDLRWHIKRLFCKHHNSYAYVCDDSFGTYYDYQCEDCGHSWIVGDL